MYNISQELVWCEAILKPFIVFFGDNVPQARVCQVNKNLFCISYIRPGFVLVILEPDLYSVYKNLFIVFFEDNAPRARVEQVIKLV